MILSRYERFIAKRYLLPGRGEAFIAIVASISLVAVMLGVAALIVVMSVMNGFRAELFEKIAGINGHAVVQGYNGILNDWQSVMAQAKATKGVTSVTPLIEKPMFATANGRSAGVALRGMTITDIRTAPSLKDKEVAGSLAAVTPGSNKIAIGRHLADQLAANVGSTVSLISVEGQSTPFGTVPRIVPYEVAAIFEIGVFDYDNIFVIMPLEDAQSFLLMGDAVGMIEVKTEDPDRVQDYMAPLQQQLQGKAQITDWRGMNAQLFEALEVDRVVSFVVLSIIILVAVFNILSSLIMLVRAKTRDIAILRTMGASRKGLLRIFMTVGVSIGALGTLAGVVLGFVFLYFRQGIVTGIRWLTGQEIWDPKIRFLAELPSLIEPMQVVGIVAMAFLLTFLATLYPAFKAASTDPVQVLRYE